MTARSRWLVLLGMAGFALGVLRNLDTLTWLSLTVLIWLFVEWLCFYWRLWAELPRLQIQRSVGGRQDRKGFLFAGRKVTVDVNISVSGLGIGPMVVVHDCLPENFSVEHGNCERELLTRTSHAAFQYEVRVRGAGQAVLAGFRIILQDAQGFFSVQRFVPCEQTFRVLPAYADFTESQPLTKRMNSLPQHGIHRLQRAGLGSELLELREYVPGDPPKSIAWKVSARRDTLMTRQYESEVPDESTCLSTGRSARASVVSAVVCWTRWCMSPGVSRDQRFPSVIRSAACCSMNADRSEFLPAAVNEAFIVCWKHNVQVLNSDLTFSSSFGKRGNGKGQFEYPRGIACDSTGKMYVANRDNHRVQVFTAEGKFLKIFGRRGAGREELSYPAGVAIDSNDMVYVTELGNNRVSIFTSEGVFVTSFGSHGEGPGQFNSPAGVAVDNNGVVYVSDHKNHRVQIF